MVGIKKQKKEQSVMERVYRACCPFDEYSSKYIKTLRELDVLRLMAEIRRKPEWTTKIFNEEIVSKWRSEVKTIEEAMFQYAIDECRYYASKATNTSRISAVDGVYEADHIIDTDLRSKLQSGINNVLDTMDPDWHPKSNDMVLDIIHPSLFPIIYGTSRFYTDEKLKELNLNPLDIKSFTDNYKSAEIAQCPEELVKKKNLKYCDFYSISMNYQWLPADVIVTKDSAKFTSYINNLHPDAHAELYDVLGKLVYHFCPLFESTLSHALVTDYGRDEGNEGYDVRRHNEAEEREETPEGEESDEDESYDEFARIPLRIDPWSAKFDHKRREPTEVNTVRLIPHNDSESTKLQIIVKAANIHLTPEKPSYPGGAWHVEGMRNERIVSTGLYYYDNCNITQSRLDFRVSTDDPEYEQGDGDAVKLVYGIDDDAPLQSYLGGVETNEGRMIAFTNNYQHQVQPFELEDKTKNGHRKIIALFLIDPAQRVPSSSSVLPQNQEWWEGDVHGIENVNPDCRSLVFDYCGFPYNLKTAKEHREKLMEERSILVNSDTDEIVRNFSLCEH